LRFNYPLDIHFGCSKCGLCCGNTANKVRHVLLLKSDAERIAKKTNQVVDMFAAQTPGKLPYLYELRKSPEGKCVFLYNNQCTIYDDRPLICRFYPFELSTDSEGVSTFRFTNECPGVCTTTAGIGDKLEVTYFRMLFELARVELKDSPR